VVSYQPQPSDAAPPASPSLDQPHYGISFGGAIARGFKKYATFAGRASRSEYWWWFLFTFVTYLVLGLAAYALGRGNLTRRGSDPWPPGATPDHLVRGLFPRNHRAHARIDRPPFARCWIQRAICAAPAHPLRRELDHDDLRVVAELAGRSEVRPETGNACLLGEASESSSYLMSWR
jgi:hypothetical protein